ncbi:MAG: hypothetical protein R6V44_01115 [Paracoccaceae bacterium]
MPFAAAEAMQTRLAEIGRAVARGAHAAPMPDRAGWRRSARPVAPDAITPPPSRSQEPNAVENVSRLMRDDRLSNRIIRSCDDIVDPCWEACNKLADLPPRIMALGRRARAHEFRSMDARIRIEAERSRKTGAISFRYVADA